MKITICLSLICLATVFGHHQSDSENQRSDENFISSEHSTEDHHEYDTYEHEARRKYDTSRKLSEGYKRIPAIRRTVPEEDDHEHGHKHIDSDDKRQQHHDENHGLSETDSGNIQYQPESYPPLPLQPSSAPPVVFFDPQFSGARRAIRLPVFQQRPRISRVFDVNPVSLPVAYRTINPVTYSVPVSRVRNVVLGVPSIPNQVRYTLGVPTSTFDNGGGIPVEFEFDEFLKKK